MRSCFACDKQFELHIESAQIKPEYCSIECQEEFEQSLVDEIQAAKNSGLIDSNGSAILHGSSATLTEENVKKIISQFSTRIPNGN